MKNHLRILSILFARLLLGKKGKAYEVANLNRARTQKIKRFSGKAFWGKKKGYKAGGGKRLPYLLTFMATL
jgi:hypothetical protein